MQISLQKDVAKVPNLFEVGVVNGVHEIQWCLSHEGEDHVIEACSGEESKLGCCSSKDGDADRPVPKRIHPRENPVQKI